MYVADGLNPYFNGMKIEYKPEKVLVEPTGS